MEPQVDIERPPAEPAFASILCGVDGSRQSLEAARQAAILAGAGASLTCVAVTWEVGVGATAVATLSHRSAERGLRRAREAARELGIEHALLEDAAPKAAQRLMNLAAGYDLLVLGITAPTRARGILLGDTAGVALHRSPVPVMVARRPPKGREFPREVLVAVDDTQSSHAAAEVAARIAVRHRSRVAIIAASDLDPAHSRALAEDAATICTATGTEPVLLDEHGPAPRAVAASAAELGVSLVVCGSRGLQGIAALRSASERIAHAAPCSVLVVRPRRLRP